MLTIVLSPYHLTTREPAAMASLLLADSVVTMLPAPGRSGAAVTQAAVAQAVSEAPRYLELMEEWTWAEQLFREGVIGSVWRGDDASEDARAASERIERDAGLASLKAWNRPGLFERDETRLSALAHDLLRAGPDPGVCVPVTAGLDAFAGRHGLIVARGAAQSVAQKAEARLGERLFAIAVPILKQATGERLLLGRALLEESLDALRDAIEGACAGVNTAEDVRTAADAYEAAFDAAESDMLVPPAAHELNEIRTTTGVVTITAMRLPTDAVLRSSAAAADRVSGVAAAARPEPTGDTVVSLVFKMLGRG